MLKKRFFKTKSEADVTFEFAHSAIGTHASTDKVERIPHKVELMSEFNNWQPIAMKYIKKDNVYRAKLRLPLDKQFHYRYLINNQEWHNDHNADLYLPNGYGSDNSIVSTTRER